MRTSLGTRAVAWLRVYEPLDAFPEPQRSQWRAYVANEHADVESLAEREQVDALVAAAALPPRPVIEDADDAYVLEISGIPLVCLRDPRLRSWLALRTLRADLPESLVQAFWPGVDLDQVDEDYLGWRQVNGETAPHLVASTWHVPPRWFCAFSLADREVELGTDDGHGRRVVYRTPMVEARRRLARVVKTLRATVEGSVVDDVVALARWLEEFHPLAWVELDYGGLVHVMDDDELAADSSAEDVARAVAALEQGDVGASGEAYGRLLERWIDLQRREHLN